MVIDWGHRSSYPVHPFHALLWYLTKLLRIYDLDGGCCYIYRVYAPLKAAHHSPIQAAAYRIDCYPRYQWQDIRTRKSWESDHGSAETQWCPRYTTHSSWCDGRCCVAHILRKNSELPSVLYLWCSVASQLQLISSLANWGHWWWRKLHHSCR